MHSCNARYSTGTMPDTIAFDFPVRCEQIAEQLEGARILILTFPLGFEASDAAGFTPQKWRDIFEEGKKSLGPLLADFALPGNVRSFRAKCVFYIRAAWLSYRSRYT